MQNRAPVLVLIVLLVLMQLGAGLHQVSHLHPLAAAQASPADGALSGRGAAAADTRRAASALVSVRRAVDGTPETLCVLCLALLSLGGLPGERLQPLPACGVSPPQPDVIPDQHRSTAQAQARNRGPPSPAA